MLVKNYMTRHPLMAEPSLSIVEAQQFMGENNIRHLPIVGDGKRLLGLVTRQNLLVDPGRMGSLDVWEITRYLSSVTVRDVMIPARNVISVPPDTTLEDAARIMVENKVGCLPVLEDEIVVGIITETDLLQHLMEMMATRQPSVRVTLVMPNVPGELAKLVAAVAAQGWGILALGGVDLPKDPTKWEAIIKIRNVPREKIVEVLEKVEGHQIIDVRES